MSAMTTPFDDAIKEPQREVQRLLGRCLMRIQQYEKLLKAVVANSEISGTPQNLDAARAKRIEDTSGKTLGTLARDLFETVIVASESNTPPKENAHTTKQDFWVSTRFSIELPDEDFAQIEDELREFVQLRNMLVHTFIEQHDLWSLEGCQSSQDALIDADMRIDRHLEQLQSWARALQETQQSQASFFQSAQGLDLIVNGIAPDGTVHWPTAGIVYALRAAAAKLAKGGWTSLTEASNWIAEREPEQRPEKYGCRSWQQVVHESRLFELRYFDVDGQRIARYRER